MKRATMFPHFGFFSRQISFLFNEDFNVKTLKINTTVISGSVFSSYSTPYFYWNQYFLSLFPCKHHLNIKCFRDVLCYHKHIHCVYDQVL